MLSPSPGEVVPKHGHPSSPHGSEAALSPKSPSRSGDRIIVLSLIECIEIEAVPFWSVESVETKISLFNVCRPTRVKSRSNLKQTNLDEMALPLPQLLPSFTQVVDFIVQTCSYQCLCIETDIRGTFRSAPKSSQPSLSSRRQCAS